MSLSPGEHNCVACGQRVRTFTDPDGTSYYVGVAEQEASISDLRRDLIEQAKLYGEKMRRDQNEIVRRCGEDLLALLEI